MKNSFSFKTKPSYLPKSYLSVSSEDGNFQIPSEEDHYRWIPMVEQNEIKNRERYNARGQKTLQQIEDEEIHKETFTQYMLFSDCDAGRGFSPHEKIIIRGAVRDMIKYSTRTVITCRLLLSSYADIPARLRENPHLHPKNKFAIADVYKLHNILMDPSSVLKMFRQKSRHLCQESADVRQGLLHYANLAQNTAILGDPTPISGFVSAKEWLVTFPFLDLKYSEVCHYESFQPVSSPYQGIYVDNSIFHFSRTMAGRVYILYQNFANSQLGSSNAPLVLKEILNEYASE